MGPMLAGRSVPSTNRQHTGSDRLVNRPTFGFSNCGFLTTQYHRLTLGSPYVSGSELLRSDDVGHHHPPIGGHSDCGPERCSDTPSPAAHADHDRGDDHLWALLVAYAGSILITGDRLLLENPPARSSVISPKTCVDSLLGLDDSIR